jgi:uncharacterized membrane protein
MKPPLHPFRSLLVLVIVVLALGVFFRVTHIGQKVYWHDEVFTSIRAAGYTGDEIAPNIFTGELIAPEALLQYQRLSPDRGWQSTWNALTTHPEHPPLYYLLVRFWMERFGSEVAIVRSVSVLFSLLAFPALYWLCREVFPPFPATGWIAMGLFAVSPFHVLYAQEARQSSLWTLATLLSSAALFRAMRVQTWASWGLYAITVALSLYTFLFSVLVLVCHGLVVLFGQVGRRSVWQFLVAVGVGFFSFTPWMIVLIQNKLALASKTVWTTQPMPREILTKLWGLHFSSNFVDSGLPLDHLYTYMAPPLVVILLVYALWMLYHHTPRQTWLFIILLIALPTIALMLPDLLWGGQRSSQTRYFVPMLVGGQLAIAYLLTYLVQHPARSNRLWGRGLLAVLLTAGVLSCGLSWQAKTWWNKGVSYSNAATAEYLNQLEQPVVMSSTGATTLGNVISLSHLVNLQVRFQLVSDPAVPELPAERDRFLFFPSEALIQNLQTAYPLALEAIDQENVALLRLVEPPR